MGLLALGVLAYQPASDQPGGGFEDSDFACLEAYAVTLAEITRPVVNPEFSEMDLPDEFESAQEWPYLGDAGDEKVVEPGVYRNHCIFERSEAHLFSDALDGCFEVAAGEFVDDGYSEERLVILSEPEESAELVEARSRSIFMEAFGGEDQYLADERPLVSAFAAAKTTLRRNGISLSTIPELAVIDYTLPSNARRLVLWNPRTDESSRHLVAHGMSSGDHYAHYFSNTVGSHQSSPGLYRVGSRYEGNHGTSVRLQGLEPGVNDNAGKRAIVLHSAWYVSYKTILDNVAELGMPRIGRSRGCPPCRMKH